MLGCNCRRWRCAGGPTLPPRCEPFQAATAFCWSMSARGVLAQQPVEVRSFLLHTSLLERLSGSLCEAVTGLPDGQAMLEHLRRTNLFVSALDDVGEWYHYHTLFAEALLAQVQQREPDLIPELYRRASRWYEQQQMMIEACDYALLARDYDHAAAMMESLAYRLFGRGDFARLARWLVSLPPETLAARPRLYLVSAWLLLFDNQVERAEEMVAHIEQQIEAYQQPMVGPEWAELLSSLALFSATLALRRNDHTQAIALVEQTLQLLSNEALPLRHLVGPYLGIILGMAHRARGDLVSAEQALLPPGKYSLECSFVVMTDRSCRPTLEAWNGKRPLWSGVPKTRGDFSMNDTPTVLSVPLPLAGHAQPLTQATRVPSITVEHLVKRYKKSRRQRR